MVLRAHDIMMLFVFLCSTLALQDFVLTTKFVKHQHRHACVCITLHCCCCERRTLFLCNCLAPTTTSNLWCLPFGSKPVTSSLSSFHRCLLWKTLHFAHNHVNASQSLFNIACATRNLFTFQHFASHIHSSFTTTQARFTSVIAYFANVSNQTNSGFKPVTSLL